MNKKIFSGKQFFQMFKQLKTVGIIFTVIFAFAMAVVPITNMANIKQSIEMYGSSVTLPYVVNITNNMSMIVFTFVIYTPLLTLMCWNFLTKRNASDFYQSLPYTRVCTFLTHSCAIVVWQLITLAVAGIVSAVTYSALSDYFIVDYGTMAHTLFNVFGCNLLCMMAITLACTLTGNLFSNVIVSGMIIFLPRIMIMMVSDVMADLLPVLSSDHMFSILGKEYNILVESVLIAIGMSSGNFTKLFVSNTGAAYTIILALIYFAVSCFLFYKRKSETAGNGASSKKGQAVIRIIIGFVISFFGVVGVLTECVRDSLTADTLVGLIVCIMFAAGFMITYEAINIKSITGALKTFPSVLVAVLLSVAVSGGMYVAVKKNENFNPSAEQINSFTMKESSRGISYSQYENYFTDFISEIPISSDKAEEIFAKVLRDNIDNMGLEVDTDSRYIYMNKRSCYTIGFNMKSGTTYRNVYLTNAQIDEVMNELKNVAQYKEAMLDLPDAEDASVTISGRTEFTLDQAKDIYETLKAESREISFEKWYNATRAGADMKSDYSTSVALTFTKNGTMYTAQICINEDMPKTYEKYIKYVNANGYDNELIAGLTKCLNRFIAGENLKEENFYISIQERDPETDSYSYYNVLEYISSVDNGKEVLSNVVERINRKDAGEKVDFTKPYIVISYHEYDNDGYRSAAPLELIVPVEK